MGQESICAHSGGSQSGLLKHLVCRNHVLCCDGPSVCTCDSILEWDPEQHSMRTQMTWLEYYQCSTVVDEQDSYMYKSHYVSMNQVVSN